MSGSKTTTQAIVSYAPSPGPNFTYTPNITVRTELGANELLIRMISSGICHSDIFCASMPPAIMGFPHVYGHEGAGVVEAVGDAVKVAQKGDPVLLSYGYCGSCRLCRRGEFIYCEKFAEVNIAGGADVFAFADDEKREGDGTIHGQFFGQSSLAGLSVVKESSVVNVKDYGLSKEELKLLAPLGCGCQTGAGAVVNAANAQKDDVLLVTGLGGVGLSAVMAGGLVSGCAAVVAVDRVESRLELAKSVGASHVVNTTGLKSEEEIVEAIQSAVGKDTRISIAIDTTGVGLVINSAIRSLGKRGHFIQIGVPHALGDPTSTLNVPWSAFWGNLLKMECNFEGSCVATEFVPKMIQWWKAGKFPLEKMVEYFPASEIEKAVAAMEGGAVPKPIIEW